MKQIHGRLAVASLAIATMGLALPAAQAAELVVAHVGPFTGPLAGNGLANHEGTRACVEEANAAGGLNGNTLKLVREDDHYKPEDTVRLLREVAQRDKPIAFVNLLGSANVSTVLKEGVLDELKTPIVGVTPGADALRQPGSRWMFHVTASDTAQLRRILSHLATIGHKRVAVAYQDIPFGHGGMKFIDETAPALKLDVVARVAVPSAAEDLSPFANQLRDSKAQAYVMILVPNSGSSFVRDVRKAPDLTPIYGMSYVPVKGIVDKAGAEGAVGVGLAQVTPNPSSASSGLVRRFSAAMQKHAPAEPLSQLHLIGYLNCRVLLEGLRKAGSKPTAPRLEAALRTVRADLGGYVADFAGGNVASKYVDIGVISRDGRLTY